MSLQVWLSLNGNLDNQGLSDISFSDSYSPSYVDGKIGKCMNGGTTVSLTPSSAITTAGLSISMWVKSKEVSSSSTVWWRIAAIRYTNGTSHNIYTADSGNGRYKLEYSPSYNIYCNTQIWHHIVFTLECNVLTGYLDGAKIGSSNETNDIRTVKSIEVGGNSNVWICDFRVYDSCISHYEIKQISQGLVCHYKLSGIGGENLIPNSVINYTSSSYGFGSRTVSVVEGEQYTFSVSGHISNEAKNDGTRLRVYLYKSDWSYCPIVLEINNESDTTVTGTFTATQTTTLSITSYSYFSSGTSGSPVTVNWYKLEKGNKATPWCPNKSDTLYSTLGYNDNIEYDCAGFDNDGTKQGDISCVSDTPRYNGSYIPTTSSSYISTTLNTSGYANSYTFSYWAKISDMSSKMVWGFGNGNRLNVYPTGSTFCWNTGDGGSNPFQNNGTNVSFSSYNGSWHHYVITGNGTTTTLYIDGEKKGTAKTYKAITGTQLYISGWDTGTSYKWTNGNISDFRIYATCLSDEDIKELYQVSASVDKTGILSCYEFSDNGNNEITKNGVISFSDLYESDDISSVGIGKDIIQANKFIEL